MIEPAFYTKKETAARLRLSVREFDRRLPTLIAKDGFPPAHPTLKSFNKADVEAWIANTSTMPRDDATDHVDRFVEKGLEGLRKRKMSRS
mgnify:CR=1 FL=1|jgi:hypothetical protein